jgi:hypothetical protein
MVRLVVPDVDLAKIQPKPLPPRHAAFESEISQAFLEAMQDSGKTLATHDPTVRVMTARSLYLADRRLTFTLQMRIGASLRNMRSRGRVQSERGRAGA